MSRQPLPWLLCTFAAAFAVATALNRPATMAQQRQIPTAWEYARLRVTDDKATPWAWQASTWGFSATPAGALERFNGKQPANRGVTTVDVLTQAGAQGWELISTDIHPNGAGVLEEYWLKRPAQ